MRHMKPTILAAYTLAALAWLTPPLLAAPQQEQPRNPDANQDHNCSAHAPEILNAQHLMEPSRSAKVSMAEAIRIAEDHCKGKAVYAVFCPAGQPGHSQAVYKVAVVSNGRFSCAKVNAETREVLGKTDEGGILRLSIEPGLSMAPSDQVENRADGQSGNVNNSQTAGRSGRDQAAFQFARRWQKSKDLIGKTVKNAQNESLGKVEELAIDPQADRVIYGVLSFGGFLGMGDKYFAIPWSSLKLNPDYKEFALGVDKETLKRASGFNKDAWPNMADQRWATETHQFYSQEPYWRSDYQTTGDTSGMTDEQRRAARRQTSWYQPTSAWQKASDLTGKDAKSKTNNEDLGKLDEVVVDPDTGRVLYGILSYKSKLYAVPWSMWEMGPGYKHMVVAVTSDQLRNSTRGFDGNNWPNLTDENLARGLYQDYNEPVYWDIEIRTKP